jgi:hypothetical protein
MATRSQPKERWLEWLQRDVDRDGSGQLLVPQCDIKASAGEDRPFPTRVASTELRNQPVRDFRNQFRVYPPLLTLRASEVPQIVPVQFDASATAQRTHREKRQEKVYERLRSWQTWVRATLLASELNIPSQHKPFGMGQRVLQLPLSPDRAEGLGDIPMQIGCFEAVIEILAHG